ncbi:hypothetical protein DFQ27_000055 [Actinomortierella ambigua]|uniref:Uncharacterized protein n=1 Tax=Actinomortierella ambigua TaxID=1343610 RepID=A0A9P6QM80_9FUNG|nr:hypothetical protein DFQ27_000055 [Actinomortierella ambigua]
MDEAESPSYWSDAAATSSSLSDLSSDSDSPYVYSSSEASCSPPQSDMEVDEDIKALEAASTFEPTVDASSSSFRPIGTPLIRAPRAKTLVVQPHLFVSDDNLRWLTGRNIASYSDIQYHEPMCSHTMSDPPSQGQAPGMGMVIHIPMQLAMTSLYVEPVLARLCSRGYEVLSFRLVPLTMPLNQWLDTDTERSNGTATNNNTEGNDDVGDMVILEVHLEDHTSAYFAWTSLIGTDIKISQEPQESKGEQPTKTFSILHPPLALDQLWAVSISGWNPRYEFKDMVDFILDSWKALGQVYRIDELGATTTTTAIAASENKESVKRFVPSNMGGMIVRISTNTTKLYKITHPEFGTLAFQWVRCLERCQGVPLP